MSNWYGNTPAPTDKYDRMVPLDTKELVYRGEVRKVCTFAYNTRYRCWGVYFENGAGISLNISLNACAMLDSWEMLEEDARKDICDYFGHDFVSNGPGRCNGCPAEDGVCSKVMASDLVRRAKALAGVADDD